MQNLTPEQMKKTYDLINDDEDIKKCNSYLYRINKGDFSCIDEALKYTNEKYNELCFTDPDIILSSNTFKNEPINNMYIIQQTINNLNKLKELLEAKIKKEILKKEKNKDN